MIASGSLNSQDMICQVNIDVMDILWIIYDVYVKIKQRVNLLHNFV